jgi:hypothetical protein
MMVIKPLVSSMRSRHTVQVGSSMRLGVGGGKGLRDLTTALDVDPNRSALLSKVPLFFSTPGVSTVMDLINVT